MNEKKYVFWDFDGVITDSTTFVFKFWKQRLETAGYDFKLEDYQATFEAKFPFDYLREKYGNLGEDIKEEYSTYESENYALNVPLFKDMKPTLITIANNRDFFAVSSNLAKVLKETFDKHQLKAYFSDIIGRESDGYKDEKIDKIIKHYNIAKNDCVFIGDTISDMKHAQSAQIDRIAVSWGVHSREKLETSPAQIICDTPEELRKLFVS